MPAAYYNLSCLNFYLSLENWKENEKWWFNVMKKTNVLNNTFKSVVLIGENDINDAKNVLMNKIYELSFI